MNSRLFLNNVSLRIYGAAVRRPGYRDAEVRANTVIWVSCLFRKPAHWIAR